ncbi:MAG: chromosomal replication initiator protein DnaA [Candidatus Saccharimonadia bacterium]
MDKRGLWQAVLGELELKTSKASFGTWFKHTAIISDEDGQIVIGVPNIFTKAQLQKKYHGDIFEALGRITKVSSVEYSVKSEASAAAEADPFDVLAPKDNRQLSGVINSSPATVASSHLPLNPRYTFDSFVVGSSNELAYAACQAVAKNPGTKYNPLFIYGGVGLGKTHLMQAVGNEILARDPAKKIEYITSEAFTNEFLTSLQHKRTAAFSEKYRKIDVLIIDDIQFLATKERTVEEFFHTFNALHQANKQIIVSSDKPPKAIPALEDRLRSRFESGMIADVQPPDFETRSAILASKAAAQGIMLPPEVIEYLANHVKQNIRELEGALTQLIAHCEIRGVTPSVAIVTGILGAIASSKPRLKTLSPKLIIEKAASYYDVAPEDIIGPKRDKEIVLPRQVAMYLMRHEMSLSFPKIAMSVGGRDHTTAMHSVSKVEKQLELDEALRGEVNAVRERLFV